MNDFSLVRANLFRKRVRAVLLILSILVAFLIFGLLGALDRAFTGGVETAQADRLVTVNRINFTVSMPYAYYARAQNVDGVETISHASWFGGYFQDPRNFVQTFAVDPQSYLAAYPELEMPEAERAAFLAGRDCAAVGADAAAQYGWSVGDVFPLSSNIWRKTDGSSTWDVEVCAIFDAADEGVPANYVLIHYDYYNEALAFGRDAIGWMIVVTGDPARNDQVAGDIDALFANSAFETETTTEAAFSQAFIEQLGNIGLILTLVIAAAFATILMIVGTTMVMAVNERTKEIAVMKTLGFPSRRIFTMVVGESVLLSLIGGLIGLGLAWLMLMGVSQALAGFLPGLRLDARTTLTAVALMLGFGLLTGLLPAVNAMRVRIVDALGKG